MLCIISLTAKIIEANAAYILRLDAWSSIDTFENFDKH